MPAKIRVIPKKMRETIKPLGIPVGASKCIGTNCKTSITKMGLPPAERKGLLQ